MRTGPPAITVFQVPVTFVSMVSRNAAGVTPSPRRGLSGAEIVDTALMIIASDGVDGLSMRGLSAKLGVALGATYRHVGTRDELLVLCARRLFERVDPIRPPGVDPVVWVRDLVLELHDLVLAHPGMAPYMLRGDALESTDTIRQAVVDSLSEVGVYAAEAFTVAQVLTFYTVGVVLTGFSGLLAEPGEGGLQSALLAGVELILRGAARSGTATAR
jgi:AcrR family transcriptional regulator